ncbi:hypothetical protein HMI54_010737 [Coelomomyces lativittatus]|nr:hypothetical protein HMI54_010737 [Coelomomyces lativittatus]
MEQPPLPLSSSTKKTHSRLPAWWVHYRWILGFSIFILLPSLVLLFVYHQTLLNVLAQFASFVRGSPRLGTLVCMLILFLSAFPPILGFSTYFALFGFIFGLFLFLFSCMDGLK